MSNTSVQIEGLENVVSSYQSRNIPKFAIFQGRNLNFWYAGDSMEEGQEQLLNFLTMIEQSKATYTLKVYHEGDVKNGVIKNTTPDVGSVNFRLNLEPVGMVGNIGSVGNAGKVYELERKIDKLVERIELQQAVVDEEEEPENNSLAGVKNIIGVVQEVMNIPGVSDLVGGIIRGIMSKGAAPHYGISGLPSPVASVNAIENFYSQFQDQDLQPMAQQQQQQQQPDQQINDPELERALMAFVHIREAYPDALELFEKLAMKAQAEPDKLRSQISMVKTFI